YGLRLIARSPLLAATVVITLTFGISLCSCVFTLIHAETMRAHVDFEPENFLRVMAAYTFGGSRQIEPGIVSLNDYSAYRTAAAPMVDLAAWERLPSSLEADDARFNALLV